MEIYFYRTLFFFFFLQQDGQVQLAGLAGGKSPLLSEIADLL